MPTARRFPTLPVFALLALLLACTFVLALLFGEVLLASGAVVRALVHPWLPFVAAPEATVSGIVALRLPRVLLAGLVGAALSLSGAALQGLVGNPLADPYTIGVSSGASVGAGIAALLGLSGLWGGLGQPVCAFAAALAALVLVLLLSRTGGRLHTASFLLGGIVVGSLLWSFTTLLLVLARQDHAQILQFLTGTFNEANLPRVWVMLPPTLLALGAFWSWGRALDALSFGEDVARSVGVEVERVKWQILGIAALATAVSVSVAGIIGFVGLVVPHVGRTLLGPGHRKLMPAAALIGATLTILADLLARAGLQLFHRQDQVPVGIVTALVGAPFFLVLLRRQMGQSGN